MMTVMTGPAASVGMEQRNWAKLAVDQFNEAGGVGGIQVEMVEGDTEFDPAKSVLVAEQMAAGPDVYGLVGPESSQNCAATAEIFVTILIILYSMVVLGGVGTIWGAVSGGLILSILPELLRNPEVARFIFYGALILGGCWSFDGGNGAAWLCWVWSVSSN